MAVGLTRLGHTVGYLTKAGDDPVGRQIINCMRENGIDTPLPRIDPGHRAGFMLKSKTSGGSRHLLLPAGRCPAATRWQRSSP